jgi:UDP-N-acetylglucosamine--N-acetylmuramyl-(pentapeptide) pyrophosphoryl-undecaprenol N-acetylglucosamine transferase
MNAVIACGGTGGHLFPGLAVAEVLQQRGHRAMVLISEKEIDTLAVRDHLALFRFERLPAIGLPRIVSLAMAGFMRGFAVSLRRCRQFYRDFKPDAVLGMGGFTSTAPILAGRRMGLPTFIHESNAIPGKANRLNARLAGHVLLGFAACARYFSAGARTAVTGTPIRADLRTRLEPAAARALFGLDTSGARKTLLVMGGSQGAHGLNRAIADALPAWRDALQVIHLTGRDDEEMVRAAYAEAGIRAWVAAFHHRMQEAYSAADLAVARSGAASLSELAHFALPSVLIPYPFAAEDHQTFNARIYAEAGASMILAEKDAGANHLADLVLEIVQNSGRLSVMAAASHQLAPPDAALLVVETMEKNCRV